jgi:hypothetical protein
VFNDLSRIFVTQPARASTSTYMPAGAALRPKVNLNSPSNQEGVAYASITEPRNGFECRLDQCTHRTFGPTGHARSSMEEHIAGWRHNIEFAYFPHDLVFKTDIVISEHAPFARCVFGL